MKDNRSQNNPDDLFRKGIESLPEENPSPQDWEQKIGRAHV